VLQFILCDLLLSSPKLHGTGRSIQNAITRGYSVYSGTDCIFPVLVTTVCNRSSICANKGHSLGQPDTIPEHIITIKFHLPSTRNETLADLVNVEDRTGLKPILSREWRTYKTGRRRKNGKIIIIIFNSVQIAFTGITYLLDKVQHENYVQHRRTRKLIIHI
jgi:hypothetical protein